MGEARTPTAAEPIPKRRQTFVADSGHHIGHGQQIAARNALRRRKSVWGGALTEDHYTRQQDRRANLPAIKKARRAAAGHMERSVQAVAAFERKYGASVGPFAKRIPGKLLSVGREFKKPHGKPGWRVFDLDALPNGDDIPAGCEASFHTTKGLRVVRTAVA